MFALLEHTTPTETHWDLLIELSGQDRLATWRLQENPIGAAGEIEALRIGDHRRVYLDFEGQLSGGRGSVRRLDRGPADAKQSGAGPWILTLQGQHLSGDFEIATLPGRAVFRPLARP